MMLDLEESEMDIFEDEVFCIAFICTHCGRQLKSLIELSLLLEALNGDVLLAMRGLCCHPHHLQRYPSQIPSTDGHNGCI